MVVKKFIFNKKFLKYILNVFLLKYLKISFEIPLMPVSKKKS